MNGKLTQLKQALTLLIVAASLIVSTSLIGCNQQPKSMFERQAETESADDRTVIVDNTTSGASAFAENSSADSTVSPIQVKKQQAIARQPNCDASKKACQYFELNILEFMPKQPWLSSIMWKTIAQVLAPEAPLASQDQTAKDTILMSLKQVEYGEQVVATLPMYERIDTELVLHPTRTITQGSGATETKETIATGYLLVRSVEEYGSTQQYLHYVMVDVQKKLQLTIRDILLPKVSTDALLLAFTNAQQEWLMLQGVDQDQLGKWPLQLSDQWYLDEQGLHMVYQSRQLLAKQTVATDTPLHTRADTEIVDLVVPYTLLEGLIRPYYKVENKVENTNANPI